MLPVDRPPGEPSPELDPGDGSSAEDLLLTKLEPPRLHASLVMRQRLLERLAQGLDKKLTLIAAPTGSGKTTLSSMWLAAQRLPYAWLTLDESDNDPARFWRYLISACRKLDPSLGKASLAALRMVQGASTVMLLTPLINDLARFPGRFVLVMDDFQTITSLDVLSSVQFLIEHLPANGQVMLMARQEPDLPLGLLRARGELQELRAEDLRFSAAEIEAFLQPALAFPLSPASLQLLEQKTDGWAAGLRLVTLALQAKKSPQEYEALIHSFSGGHRFVLEYLRSEVIQKQPPAIHAFLLQTCFLHRLCGQLCDAVTGGPAGGLNGALDGTALLGELERADLFVVPLGASAGHAWYRYQPLFAEALRHDALQVFDAAQRLALYARAGGWYQEHGFLEEAIEMRLLAQEYEPVSRLIEQFLEQRSITEVLTLRRWCGQIPAEILYRHPVVAFHYALALLFTLDRFSPATRAAMEPLLQAAERTWELEKNAARLGEVLAARAAMAWWQGEMQASFDYSRRALALLPASEVFWRGAALLNQGYAALLSGDLPAALERLMEARALSGAANNIHALLAAIFQIGEVYFLLGELEQAEHHYRQVLAEAARSGLAPGAAVERLPGSAAPAIPVVGEEMLDDQSSAWLGLAEIAYARGDLAQAQEQARRAQEIGLHRLDERTDTLAAILLARSAAAQGNHSEALAQLEARLGQVQPPYLRSEVYLALARLCLVAGETEAAARWQAGIAQPDDLFPIQQVRWTMLTARRMIADGAPEEALALLKQPLRLAQAQGRRHQEIELLCLEALAHQALSQQPQALQLLAAALSLAQPRGLRQAFLDEGPGMAGLLRAALPGLQKRSLALFAAGLLPELPGGKSLPGGGAAEDARLVEPLSAQELRVLRLLVAGRSYPEMAGELVVSVNTIKTQVKSIYRKLNVSRRDEARQAAHALGLI